MNEAKQRETKNTTTKAAPAINAEKKLKKHEFRAEVKCKTVFVHSITFVIFFSLRFWRMFFVDVFNMYCGWFCYWFWL